MVSPWVLSGVILSLPSALCNVLPSPGRGLSASRPHKTLLPSEDPFYQPPAGFENATLGAILRQRPIPNGVTLNNKDAVRLKSTWQILYRTQNSVEEPIASVVTILKPYNAKPNNLFTYGMFSDSAFSGCNPSVTLQIGTRDDNQWNQVQTPILMQALALGYYVSVPDYSGTQAAFSAGPQAGYSILDSVRAVLASGNITGISSNPITTLHGYSSGAQAVGWATEVQPTYAPELKIAGAAFGGVMPNLTALISMEIYEKGERAFLGPPAMLGLSHDYANLSHWMGENLIPGARAKEFRTSEEQCVSANVKMLSNQDLGFYFKRGYTVLNDDVPRTVYDVAGTMGMRSTPTIPWYIYHSAGDDVSPQNLTDKIVDFHCSRGANITYEKNPLQLNHRFECAFGVTGAYRWLMDRHEGKPVSQGCSTVRLSNESKRGVSQNLLIKGAMAAAWAYLGYDVGPKGSRSTPSANRWTTSSVTLPPASTLQAPDGILKNERILDEALLDPIENIVKVLEDYGDVDVPEQ